MMLEIDRRATILVLSLQWLPTAASKQAGYEQALMPTSRLPHTSASSIPTRDCAQSRSHTVTERNHPQNCLLCGDGGAGAVVDI